MGTASKGVVSASDAIAAIAVQTNDAARQMTVGAATVRESVTSIAAVSEENSAASEEVSAATQELSAQAEEVVATSEVLADMARQLADLVARFRTPEAQYGTSSARGTGVGTPGAARARDDRRPVNRPPAGRRAA